MGLAVSPRTAAGRTWRVPGDAPTIQAGIDLAAPGDDVLVAPGMYAERDIAMKGGITVHSEAGSGSTAIQAGDAGVGFSCDGLAEMSTIEGFSISHGRADTGGDWYSSGGGVRCLSSSLAIRDCVITDCYAGFVGGGIMAMQSDVSIEGCTVSACEAYGVGGICGWDSTVLISGCEIADNEASTIGGIYAFGPKVTIIGCVVKSNVATWGSTGGISCSSLRLTIRDCLITDSREIVIGGASAIDVWDSAGTISGCTVAFNDGWYQGDPAVSIMNSDVLIEKTIIAFNSCEALHCNYDAEVNVSCCDLFGNYYGDGLCGDDLGGNFSQDPLFCDSANGVFTVSRDSPCLPGNHPDGIACGLIGALGQGCGAPPTGACCFADGSCIVAEQEDCENQDGAYQGDGSTCEPNPCKPTSVLPESWGQIKALFR
jgi:hypothetical protein